jgi:hypothetical protein
MVLGAVFSDHTSGCVLRYGWKLFSFTARDMATVNPELIGISSTEGIFLSVDILK